MNFNLSQPVSSILLVLSTNVQNNFINRGISTVASSKSLLPNSFVYFNKKKENRKEQTQQKKPFNPMWVTGLTDAEGSFIISIYKRKETNKWQINPFFQLWLETKDLSILEGLKDFFGVGILNTRENKGVTSFSVTKINDLMNVVIPHFSNFPLQTQKKVDFDFGVKIVELISKKEHLTPEGVLKIFSLKSVLNKGLSKNISNIDNIEILERPLHLVDLD